MKLNSFYKRKECIIMPDKSLLIGAEVTHHTYGKGMITDCMDRTLTVYFGALEKKFIFPDAIPKFLQPVDQTLETYADEERAKKNFASTISKPQVIVSDIKTKKKLKQYPRSNIAFKCNFCDGGKTSARLGFNGVCSDEMIRNNIEVERHIWCGSDDCPCRRYFDGGINREELEEIMKCSENTGTVCYESGMLRDWKASAGIVQKGENKGKSQACK